MSENQSKTTIDDRFTVSPYLPEKLGLLKPLVASAVDRVLGLKNMSNFYHGFPADMECYGFAKAVLDGLGVSYEFNADDLARIPAEGPCIVVSNHPHGMVDGLFMMALLQEVRKDFRIMANYFLGQYTQLRPLFVEVNPFGGREAIRQNIASARFATQFIQDGHMLMMFPGGEVSSLDGKTRKVMDPEWDPGIARFVEKTGAPVVPIYIHGRNSSLFQAAGLINERLRTALLVREMMNKDGYEMSASVGESIEAKTLCDLGERDKISHYLRSKTYLVGENAKQKIFLGRSGNPLRHEEAIVSPIDSALLREEIDRLPDDNCLISSGNLKVLFANSSEIPQTVQEIGRLRELSFRGVGEGTGKKSDLDLFDTYYVHLFIWDESTNCIAGGYRLGHTDRILDKYGSKGLYLNSLFKLDKELEHDIRSALEVGRSFVSPAYQKQYSSLMLLWKGIAHYVARHPQYRILFGPVSISNDYHPISQELLVRYLSHTNDEKRRASQVTPRQPYRSKGKIADSLVDLDATDLNIIADLLNTVEQDDKGIPVILRQYLKLGGQILGFNIDPDFNNSVDCLLWVDLMRTEVPLLRKYMGREGSDNFRAYHLAQAEKDSSKEVSGAS
ncbi:MAG: lysophospholipid acyltransferase family protein [Gammaproteobacteria bacterium]